MGKLNYLTKEGFRNLKVNKLMSVASITVLFSCLMLIGIAFMLLVNIEAFISGVEGENIIMAYVDDAATDIEIKKVGLDLEKIPNVQSVEKINKEEAYRDILSDMDENLKVYLEGLEENPLPDAYRITVRNMSSFDTVVEQVKSVTNIFRVRENSSLAKQLSDLRDSVTTISIVIIVMLLLVSLFIISNTIKVTMFSRRLEISIMKSVGATNSFIRWPFMVEGIVIGVIAGILATGAVWLVSEFALSSLTSSLSIVGASVEVNFIDYALWLALAFVGIGVFTGVFGSATSMRKYLKERKFVELEEE
ncbi:MAG: permease-like cell division protein FtsX [Clostridia bacterium]|nr:permease-like cell division protein FtsX [Clostridia bacterium]